VHERVSVVVITRNRHTDLLGALSRLVALPEKPPVILVDNGSSDGTPAAVAHAFPQVQLIALGDNRGGSARNIGVRAAQTPYVAFADDDSWWAPGALDRAAAVLTAHPRLALINGHILVGPDERDDPVCAAMARSPLEPAGGQPGHALLSFIACGAVVRRTAFLAVGGFLPELQVGGEEEILAADLAAVGWQMSYLPEIVAHHHPSLRRDADRRRANALRNVLWTTWLRRPLGAALRGSARALADAPRDRVTARAVGEAMRGLPWVVRRRRPAPPHVEAMRRRLEPAR
jgi:N-acetylglucosaminyl-diphospho-decaprenol L-rhamnosyltransferase